MKINKSDGCGGGGIYYDDYVNNNWAPVEYKFKIGDKVKCIDFEQKKLSDDCMEFLSSKKFFTVIDVRPNNKIDIGYVKGNGKVMYFTGKRFKKVILKNKK